MALTRDGLIDYLRDTHGINPADIEDDDAELFSSGLLDSFSMVDLIVFIEAEGGFKVNPNEVNLDNLDSVGRLLSFARQKTSD